MKDKDMVRAACDSYMAQGSFYEVLSCVVALIELDETDAAAYYSGAAAYLYLGDTDNALALAKRAISLRNDYIEAYMILAFCYEKTKQLKEQIEVAKKIIALYEAGETKISAGYDFLGQSWALLANAYKLLGETELAVKSYLKFAELAVDPFEKAHRYSDYLMCLHYDAAREEQEVFQAHMQYDSFFKEIALHEHGNRAEKEKIRIGYISPDFRQHAVVFFAYALLAAYDHHKFEVYCYASSGDDQTTAQLKRLVDQWRDIRQMPPECAAKLIYEDEIDILMDLAGHTASNSLPVLAYKPAPVQISGIGYFNTTGLRTVDYFLTDHFVDPEESAHAQFFTEKLLRLPGSHFCYTARSDAPECGEAPCLRNGYVTFCCFNNFTKVTNAMLILWQKILERTPRARIVFRSQLFSSAFGREKTKQRLLALQYDVKRVELQPFGAEHMKEYLKMDIALDTAPYPGGATSCEALYMGVPVITLVGRRHGARFGYSILKNGGFVDGIAFSPEEYVEKAVALAKNTDALAQLHLQLRSRMQRSPLMDGHGYMRALEKLYQQIWQDSCRLKQARSLDRRSLIQESPVKIRARVVQLLQNSEDAHSLEEGEQLLALLSEDWDLKGMYAALCIECDQPDKARRVLDAALQARPHWAQGLFLLARIYMQDRSYEAVLQTLRRLTEENARELQENKLLRKMVFNLYGYCLLEKGDAAAAAEYYLQASKAASGEASRAANYSNYVFTLNYLPDISREKLFLTHKKYNKLFADVRCYRHERKAAKEKIHIGYISPDFRHHIVVFFTYQLLAKYDCTQFFVTCYDNSPREDETTAALKGLVDAWKKVDSLSGEQTAALIYQDQVDILFDLAGHSARNALPVLARKPAPVQISGIGYFNTTGLAAVDYFLTDVHCDPEGLNDRFFTERLLRLPHSHFCYTPPTGMPECAAAPCLKNGYITFGSFNNFAKTTDAVLAVWQEILTALPKAKLVLKNKNLNASLEKTEIVERMHALGFDLSKVEFRPSSMDYLHHYHDVDIALDTFPYPGGGTTCEALYMGVPVITLTGERHGSRFGYSLLKNVGLEECIAYSKADYVRKSIALAEKPVQIAHLHTHLRAKMQASPLMDGKSYVAEMETAYRKIWALYLVQQTHGSVYK